MDLATIGEVCRVSGGQMYKFNYFSVRFLRFLFIQSILNYILQVENDGERLLDELKRNFQRPTAFDALMRVRTSAGIDFYYSLSLSLSSRIDQHNLILVILLKQ